MAGFLRGVTELTLSFGGVTANITDIQRGQYSRKIIPNDYDAREKLLNNTVVVSGDSNQPDFEWEITFFATEGTVQALEEIHLLSKLSATPECQLVDLISPVMDVGTITRLTAPSPNNTVNTTAAGNKFYFATFNVIITDINPRGRSLGTQPDGTQLWEVSLSLEEASETA